MKDQCVSILLSDYMDDFQRQKEMTAHASPSKRSFFLT